MLKQISWSFIMWISVVSVALSSLEVNHKNNTCLKVLWKISQVASVSRSISQSVLFARDNQWHQQMVCLYLPYLYKVFLILNKSWSGCLIKSKFIYVYLVSDTANHFEENMWWQHLLIPKGLLGGIRHVLLGW